MTLHALISGGSGGIGTALAKQLVASGYKVSILARDQTRLDNAVTEIRAGSRNDTADVLALSVDVVDAQAVQQAVELAARQFGAPSLVVCCAGIVIPATFADLPVSAFRQTMDINYLGAVHIVKAALPFMQAAGSGHIVLVSSGAGLLGVYGLSAYSPGKFALRGLGEVLRAELKPENIRVSVVYPPDTDTPMLREEIKIRPEITSRIAGATKTVSAEFVATAILKGLAKNKFTIAPGFDLSALAFLGGIIAPIVNRFQFDPMIARLLKRK